MNVLRFCLFLLIITAFTQPRANTIDAERTFKNDTLKNQPDKKPVRIYNTTRIVSEKPIIDGILGDKCWESGNWAGDFTQWVPSEGEKPSQPTFLQIRYDDQNIYVAIRAVDREPQKIQRKAGRRDEFAGDLVGVCFDSYHDHRTGFEFDVTAAGQKYDAILTNPWNGDEDWNAVWYAKTAMEDSAWTVEMQIPLSQLRYSKDDIQVWGLHCWRWIERLKEESDWELQSMKSPGMLYLFGELHGIKGLTKSRRIEFLTSGLGKIKTFEKDPGNPFADKGYKSNGNIGLDAKIGLSSNFTVDLTVNPDFGQVEADPSVMNLTAYETFYDEKRPFFLEGKNIYSFDIDDVNLFYSRRIGHSPGFVPDLAANEYVNMPENTTIVSAAKLSGKTVNGLSVGILQSITANEFAEVNTPLGNNKVKAEPFTNYFVGRVQKDFREGNTILGGILTSANRFIRDTHLGFMNRNALTGGLDLLHQWKDKEFYLDAKIVGSNITGNPEAINKLQLSSARYFQRPDAEHLSFDSTLNHLSGFGGKIKIGKGSKGLWRYSTEVTFRSPSVDFNDLGYMQTADIIKQASSISYFVNKPISIFRTYTFTLKQSNNWDFGLNYLSSGGSMSANLTFLNKWNLSSDVNYTAEALDTHLLRGGSAMLVPENWKGSVQVKSDYSKKVAFNFKYTHTFANNRGEYSAYNPSITIRPFNTLKLSVNLNYASNADRLQYIKAVYIDGDRHNILARVSQQTLSATFRIDYNIIPELSVQYYGSPFASVGKYSEFKDVLQPRSSDFGSRYKMLDYSVRQGDNYQIDENGDGIADFSIHNPDFNYYQFRSNFVVRWEYRPGSQIYFVWSNDRTSWINPGYDSVNDLAAQLSRVFPVNIFLVKLNYWFSL